MKKFSSSSKGDLETSLAGLRIAGVDEVGRGCLAGPVYAGCAVLDFEKCALLNPKDLDLIRDSKTLSSRQRKKATEILAQVGVDLCIGVATVREIEKHGILEACFLAMRRALSKCRTPIDVLLVDGQLRLTGYSGEQKTIIDGDKLCYNIAAASIIAKEARDHYMQEQSRLYPVFGFEKHVGYGTQQHMAAIKEYGVCPLHRRNFAPIREALAAGPRSLSLSTLSDTVGPS